MIFQKYIFRNIDVPKALWNATSEIYHEKGKF